MKRFMSIIIVAIMILGLCACGNQSTTTDSTAGKKLTQKISTTTYDDTEQSTIYVYDSSGLVTQVAQITENKESADDVAGEYIAIEYEYDDNGNPVKIIFPYDEYSMEFEIDNTYENDEVTEVKISTEACFSDINNTFYEVVSTVFDLISQHYENSTICIYASDYSWTERYEDGVLRQSTCNSETREPAVEEEINDQNGNLLSYVEDDYTENTEYEDGRIASITSGEDTYSFAYEQRTDSDGNSVYEAVSSGITLTYVYDENDNLESYTNENGSLKRYWEYNKDGDLIYFERQVADTFFKTIYSYNGEQDIDLSGYEELSSEGQSTVATEGATADTGTTSSELVPVHIDGYTLSDMQGGFSEGLAWVYVIEDESSQEYLAVINQNSEIIYLTDKKIDDYTVGTTPFINGLSAVFTHNHSNAEDSQQGFVIIDKNGCEVYEDNESYMCGVGKYGDFLIAKHESGFSGDTWFVYMLDSNLNLSDPIEFHGKYGDSDSTITYLANDLYEFEAGVFYRNQCVINFNYNYSGVMPEMSSCIGGKYLVSGRYGNAIPVSAIANAASADEISNILENDEVYNCWIKDEYGFSESPDYYWDTDPATFTSEIYVEDGEYYTANIYDADLNVIYTYPQLPEGAAYRMYEKPSNGYYVAYMEGVDRNIYTTAFNEQGTMEYDPVMISRFSHYTVSNILQDSLTSFAGYSITTEEIVDPSGNIVNLGDDLTGLDIDEDFAFKTSYLTVYISDGFIYYKNKEIRNLVSLDGTTEIYGLTASYNENGQLVFDGIDESALSSKQSSKNIEEAVDGQDQDTTVSKTYTSISNFKIEGKWKNIGSGTFGQAQSGAIIVFDGTNCNFFSPQDTYAISKDGDNYKLDCTSYMSTDTLTFTVKTVDQNNIDIYYGDTVVELTRVD